MSGSIQSWFNDNDRKSLFAGPTVLSAPRIRGDRTGYDVQDGRAIVQIDIEGLRDDAPELKLAALLDDYRELHEKRLAGESRRRRAMIHRRRVRREAYRRNRDLSFVLRRYSRDAF